MRKNVCDSLHEMLTSCLMYSCQSWVWSCQDFSGDVSEGKTFVLRFCSSEAGPEFKEKYEASQMEMKNLFMGDNKPNDGGKMGEKQTSTIAHSNCGGCIRR